MAKKKVTEEVDLSEDITTYGKQYVKDKIKGNQWELVHGQMIPNKVFNVRDIATGKVMSVMIH